MEDAHRFGAQAVGCVKRKRGWLCAAEFEFPDVIVEVVGDGKA